MRPKRHAIECGRQKGRGEEDPYSRCGERNKTSSLCQVNVGQSVYVVNIPWCTTTMERGEVLAPWPLCVFFCLVVVVCFPLLSDVTHTPRKLLHRRFAYGASCAARPRICCESRAGGRRNEPSLLSACPFRSVVVVTQEVLTLSCCEWASTKATNVRRPA